jgi:VCBS repeat-containing protein
LPPGFSISPDGRTLVVNTSDPAFASLAQGQSRTFDFDYEVVDSSGARTTQSARITVAGSNDAPIVATPIADQSVPEDTAWTFQVPAGTFTDPDSPTLTYTASLANGSPLPAWLTFDATTRTFSGTPPQNFNGTLSLTVTATDGSLTASDSFDLSVTPLPPPTFDGSFETGFTGWDRTGDTRTQAGGTSGAQQARISTSSSDSLSYREIETFLGVPGGILANNESATNSSNGATIGSALRTTSVRLEAGQSFRFDWNFSTSDYSPFNDFAVFTIDELDAIFELADVESVGDGGSTGWRTYTFTARQTGEYHFGFAVLDTGDGSVASTLLIDNVRVESIGAPILTGTVAAIMEEDSGSASIDLLAGASDPDGSALRVENLDWHNSPGSGLPPGFSLGPDGRTLVVNTSHPAFQSSAQGQSRVFAFDYEVVDASGARTTQSARITVAGTSDAPVVASAIADQGLAEDTAWSFQVPAGTFTDVDGPALTYAATLADGSGLLSWLVFDATTRTFSGTPPANFNGTVSLMVTASDGRLSASDTFDLTVTRVNDAPTVAGASTGTTREDATLSSAGQLSPTDPDPGSSARWEVSGGTAAEPADYLFRAETLRITRSARGDPNAPVLYEDRFDGTAPTSDTSFGTGLAYSRSLTQAGGDLTLQDEDGNVGSGVGTPDPFNTVRTFLQSNANNASTAGLKKAADFTVTMTFDLIVPDDLREAYGFRLSDERSSGAGDDDVLELLVRRGPDGVVRVYLRQVDFITDTVTTLQALDLPLTTGADQIQLRLMHSAGSNQIGAAFDLLTAGTVTTTVSFTQFGTLFGADTPASTADDENYTFVNVLAFAPATADSYIEGQYGTLVVNQAGAWTYNLRNSDPAVQALAQGETVTDTFQVTATDDQGAASTPYPITITVQGTNDAPVSSAEGATEGVPVSGIILSNDSDRDHGATLANAERLESRLLNGGSGRDLLVGSSGADAFVFGAITDSGATVGSADVIADFVRSDGDKIDLRGLGVGLTFQGNSTTVSPNSFSFFEDAAGDRTIVQVERTGDATVDLAVVLRGTGLGLQSGDFLLS